METITRILLSALAALLAMAAIFGAVIFITWCNSPSGWEESWRFSFVPLSLSSGVIAFILFWGVSEK